MTGVVLGVLAVVCLVAGAVTSTPFNGVDLLGVVLGAAAIGRALDTASRTEPPTTHPTPEEHR